MSLANVDTCTHALMHIPNVTNNKYEEQKRMCDQLPPAPPLPMLDLLRIACLRWVGVVDKGHSLGGPSWTVPVLPLEDCLGRGVVFLSN